MQQTYFNSYTNSLDYCFNRINEYHIIKNVKLDLLDTNKKLHIQIYRMNINTFELNYYVN
jgi:hypothetical protein